MLSNQTYQPNYMYSFTDIYIFTDINVYIHAYNHVRMHTIFIVYENTEVSYDALHAIKCYVPVYMHFFTYIYKHNYKLTN